MTASIKQRMGSFSNVSNASELRKLFEAVLADGRDIVTLVNELRADHATYKTCIDQIETLIEELHDDHATTITVINDVKTLANDIRSALQGDNLLSAPTLAVGSTATAVSNIAFTYVINGIGYNKAAVAAGTAPGDDVIPEGTFGAVAFDIGVDGTIDAIEATANATGYDSAVLAIAGLPAAEADHVRMGTVTASKSDGAFTFGTTELSAANVTEAYTDGTTIFNAISAAVSTSPAATLTAPKPASAPATITAAEVTATLTD